ncbi:MAG: hypothetical protein KDD53_04495, partial [Bdellovibrionales bacterium]|nr:hypothetical protein [Bdellovibrionales bacterium]
HLISFADISRSLTSDANIYLMLSAIGSNYNFKASPDPITNPEPTLEQQLLLPLSSLEYDIPAHGGKTPINPATAPDPYSVSVLTKHFDTAIADPSSLPHGTWKGPPWYIDPSIYDAGVTTPQSPEVANPGVVPPSMISYLRNHYTDVKIAYSLALESYLYAVSNIFDSLDFYIFAAASTGGGVVGKTVPEEDELDEYLNGVFPIIKSEQGPLLTTALLPNTFQMRNIVDYEHGGNATKQIGVLFDAQGASQMAFGDQWLPGSLEYDAFYADVSSIPGGGVAGALTMKQIGMCKSLEGPTLVWNPEWPDPTPQYMKRGISPTNVVQGPSFRVSRYGGNYIGPGITSNFAPCVARHFVAKPGGTDTLGVLREAAARTTAVRATNPDIQVGIAIITDGIPNLPVSGTPGDPASEPYLADIGYVAMHPVDWDSQLFPALKAEKTKLKNLKVNVFTLFVDTEINQPQSEIDKRDDYLNLMNDPDNGFYLVYLKVLSSSGTSDAIAVVDQLESAIQAFAALMQSVAIIYTHQYSGG